MAEWAFQPQLALANGLAKNSRGARGTGESKPVRAILGRFAGAVTLDSPLEIYRVLGASANRQKTQAR